MRIICRKESVEGAYHHQRAKGYAGREGDGAGTEKEDGPREITVAPREEGVDADL